MDIINIDIVNKKFRRHSRRNFKGKKSMSTLLLLILVAVLIAVFVVPFIKKYFDVSSLGFSQFDDNECRKKGHDESFYNTEINKLLEESLNEATTSPLRKEKQAEAAKLLSEFAGCYGNMKKIRLTGEQDIGEQKIVWLADGLYEEKDNNNALYFYKKYYDDYGSRKDDYAKKSLYMSGKIYYEDGQFSLAKEQLTKLKNIDSAYKENEVWLITLMSDFKEAVKNDNKGSNKEEIDRIAIELDKGYYSLDDSTKTQIDSLIADYYIKSGDYEKARHRLSNIRIRYVKESLNAQYKYALTFVLESKIFLDYSAEKINKLKNAATELDTGYGLVYNELKAKGLVQDWRDSNMDLAKFELCKIRYELAKNLVSQSVEQKGNFGLAKKDCEEVAAYTGSLYAGEAQNLIPQIKKDCESMCKCGCE